MPVWTEYALFISPNCDWTVTWPTRPGGEYTIPVQTARDADDAIAQARALNSPTAPNYHIDYNAEPAVWRIKRFGRSCHVSGPTRFDHSTAEEKQP